MLLNKVFHPVFLGVDEFVILSFSQFCSNEKNELSCDYETWTSNQTSLPLLSFKGVLEGNILKHWCLIFGLPLLTAHTHTHVPAPPSSVAFPLLYSALTESDTEKTSQMTKTEKKKQPQRCDSATYFNALKNPKKKKKITL